MIRVRRLLPSAAGLLLLALLLRLGFWQLERAAYKDRLEASFEASESAAATSAAELLALGDVERWRFRRTRASGTLEPRRQYLLDNRTHRGRAGYHVLSVLPLDSAGLLVNRGWVPVGPDRARLPDLAVDAGAGVYAGRLVPPPATGVLLGASGHDAPGWPKVVQNVDLERMASALDTRLLPAVLLLDPKHAACFVCEWSPVPGVSAERHRGYAVQWFALAVALVVIAGTLTVRALRRHHG